MPSISEVELIASAQAGNLTDFDKLVKQHLSGLYHYLVTFTKNPVLAEDTAQETFIRAWKYIQRFDTSKPFKPWLFSIARNIAIDTLRRRQNTPFSSLSDSQQTFLYNQPDDSLSPQDQAINTETSEQVINILHTLKPIEQEVLTLHYNEDLSTQGIATILNLPHETVRTRLRRAKTAFKKAALSHPEPIFTLSPVLPADVQKSSTNQQHSLPGNSAA